jgi:uncharacterized membrane protein YdfJ with MMPL/SSD domain
VIPPFASSLPDAETAVTGVTAGTNDFNEQTTDQAVANAIRRTAGTVTSAAIIMVAVFGLFATLSLIDIKQMGFGLAVAVLIDAKVIRAVLLPATMKLPGDGNWYLPAWLEWLPTLSPEGPPEGSAPESAPVLH